MKEKYTPGEGCQCHAHSEAECGCDVDWTPREVYELREQRDKALCELEMWKDGNIMHESHRNEIQGLEQQRDRLAEALRELWDNHTLHGAAYELIKNTLAAVKG
jgi:hypothetical protein